MTRPSVGSKHKGDGTFITLLDSKGNREADRLATLAAETHRVLEAIRDKIAYQVALMSVTVHWIGRAAYQAHHQDKAPHRDVEGGGKTQQAEAIQEESCGAAAIIWRAQPIAQNGW